MFQTLKFWMFYFRCLIFGQFLSHFKQISGHNFSTWLKHSQGKYTATKRKLEWNNNDQNMIVLLHPQSFTIT